MTDAFDSDVLIFAARGDRLGASTRAFLAATGGAIGSVILLPEVLSKPFRLGDEGEVGDLATVLGQIELKEVDEETAQAASAIGAKYNLRAADAIHLATAVIWGAARFHTNNRKDFGPHITEVQVVWPD